MTRCVPLILTLILCAGVCMAQEEPADQEQALEEQRLAESVAAYREIQMVRIIQALQLTPEQAAVIVTYMEAIQQQLASIAEESTSMPRRELTAVQNVLKAWMELGPVDPADRDAGWRAIRNHDGKTKAARERVDALIADVKARVLDERQREVLETHEEVAARERQAQRRQTAGGADTAQVIQAIQRACLLDPETFDQRLNDNAQAIARSIVGDRSPVLGPLADRVRGILLQLQPLTAEDWQSQQALLSQQIILALGLAGQAADEDETTDMGDSGLVADQVAEEAFDTMLKDTRALDLLKRILAAITPDEAPPGDGVDADPIPPAAGAGQ